jgi:hypothetical protein
LRWREDESETETPDRLKQLVDWELVLAADNVSSSLHDLSGSEHWRSALPTLSKTSNNCCAMHWNCCVK